MFYTVAIWSDQSIYKLLKKQSFAHYEVLKMEGKDPLISIIMPAYNAAKYITQSIESVIAQTFMDWELIVVNDGSTDETESIIKKMQKQDKRIHYFYQSNKKQAAARNLGISYSKSKWIAFLDADDLWESTKLAIQVKVTEEVDSDVFFTGGYVIDANGKILSEYNTIFGSYTGIEIYKKLYFYNPVPVLSVMVKRSWIVKVGQQDEDLRIAGCEDWDYWVRLAYNNARFYGINELLFKYRTNPDGTTRNILQMKIAECSALYKNVDLNLFSSNEKNKVKQRFDNLIKFIINGLYKSNRIQLVPYYLDLVEKINGGSKYRFAKLILRLFGAISRRPVNFILYH